VFTVNEKSGGCVIYTRVCICRAMNNGAGRAAKRSAEPYER